MSAFRQSIQVFRDSVLSPDALHELLVKTAIEARDDLIASGEAGEHYETYADGRPGDASEARQQVYFRWGYLAEAAAFALGFLQTRSPHRSGRFARSFWVAVDGRYIPPGQFQPDRVPPFAEVIIGNILPQNRKVDVQADGSLPLRFSVPAGMYDDAVRAVKRQFSGLVTAKRAYDIDFPGKYTYRRSHAKTRARFQSPVIILNPLT
jgi:hypothetical protein